MSYIIFFFFKQKTAYEMRISDWSSDVCSSDLTATAETGGRADRPIACRPHRQWTSRPLAPRPGMCRSSGVFQARLPLAPPPLRHSARFRQEGCSPLSATAADQGHTRQTCRRPKAEGRSEEPRGGKEGAR